MNEHLNVIRNNYANFTGRARRREYWMFTLVNTVISLIFGILLGVSSALSPDVETGAFAISPFGYIGIGLLTVYSLAVLVPSLAVNIRRLHDAGFSGWLVLVSLVPGGSLLILVFHCLDSKPGSNKWGPNPKGVQAPANAF